MSFASRWLSGKAGRWIVACIVAGSLPLGLAIRQHRFGSMGERSIPVWQYENFGESYRLAAENWMTRLGEDGFFTYVEDIRSAEFRTTSNNVIRQVMSTRLLGELARECPGLLSVHRRNLDAVLSAWYQETADGRGLLLYDGKAKTGASGIMLRALATSPFAPEYGREMHALARGILAVWDGGRNLDPWLVEPSYDYDGDYLLTFYSGEAILGLQEAGDEMEDAGILAAARGMQEGFARYYVDSISEAFYPSYVPWHTMSMKRYATAGEDQGRWTAAVRLLNTALLDLQDTTYAVGRFFDPAHPEYGRPHAASDAIYVESLSHAYEIARETGDSIAARHFLRAIVRGVEYLGSRQIWPNEVSPYGLSPDAAGAIPDQEGGTRVRIDNLQHTLDAFRSIRRLLQAGLITISDLQESGVEVLGVEDDVDELREPVCPEPPEGVAPHRPESLDEVGLDLSATRPLSLGV